MNRQITSNGKVFRIEYQSPSNNVWNNYSITFDTLEKARTQMEKWNAEDKLNEGEWKKVE